MISDGIAITIGWVSGWAQGNVDELTEITLTIDMGSMRGKWVEKVQRLAPKCFEI